MNLDSQIKHYEREALRQLFTVPVKTGIFYYVGKKFSEVEFSSQELYFTKGFLWADQKISGLVDKMLGNDEIIQEFDSLPFILGGVGLIYAINTARTKIIQANTNVAVLKTIKALLK